MERLSAEGKFFHRSCFKCEYCATTLRLSAYAYDLEDGESVYTRETGLGLLFPLELISGPSLHFTCTFLSAPSSPPIQPSVLFLSFGCTCSIWKSPARDQTRATAITQSHSSDNAGSLTH